MLPESIRFATRSQPIPILFSHTRRSDKASLRRAFLQAQVARNLPIYCAASFAVHLVDALIDCDRNSLTLSIKRICLVVALGNSVYRARLDYQMNDSLLHMSHITKCIRTRCPTIINDTSVNIKNRPMRAHRQGPNHKLSVGRRFQAVNCGAQFRSHFRSLHLHSTLPLSPVCGCCRAHPLRFFWGGFRHFT